jgi:acetolactate synthase I/II/III large subunit
MATADKTTHTEIMTGASIIVEALIRNGTQVVFAYPGGCSMPLHQALLAKKDVLRTILPRHEQGGGFAAQGVARTTGRAGVCIATSGPGATNLVTAIADAKLDSIPMVALTAQVPTAVIGTDAFQETPMVEICRGITKHHYLVTRVEELARVVKEAFYVATTGRPGPVLIDIPKDVQIDQCAVDWDEKMNLPGYRATVNPESPVEQIKQVAAAIKHARRPLIYAGGGIVNGEATEELRELIATTGIPTTLTLMGLGVLPPSNDLCMDMLGMHGTVYANKAVSECDLLIALGVRFDDRVTGNLERFAPDAKIVHIDIDPSEINKNKTAHIPIVCDVKDALRQLLPLMEYKDEIEVWRTQCQQWKRENPLTYDQEFDGILQQHAIAELSRLTSDLDPFITVGVGQHQMWSAQFFQFQRPRRWLSSSGLGTMGFGLPAAMGVQAANPDKLVIDIDGDGSFQMNIQELATCKCENLPVKIMLLNNQHLGMVVQWEDRFMDGRRAHTYLGPIGDDEALGQGSGPFVDERYPDFVQIAKGYGCGAATVNAKADLSAAIQEMIACDGPYLLDVQVPYQSHVLPMIPSGGSVENVITE